MSAFDKLYEGVIPDTPVKPPRPPNPTRSSRGRTTRANSWLPDPNHSGYEAPTDIDPTSPTKLPFHDELAMAHFSPTIHSGPQVTATGTGTGTGTSTSFRSVGRTSTRSFNVRQ
jgi:hypothetical protein